ncbi:tRNA (guanine-N(7)-)-methyltransferase non-catalytic subunit wdr4-like [Salvelinus fontinalis]|uniref:tRNA (guanine-N(7)-)-methyltransferase non-catalytic subunit wdr4-like n=1 Tax=Salvelinus fontinalis TaxID=8038 RepID=UPI002485DD5D|nr:tRNA (guanine-N(7)-)-methyltransferase non-catalytic subunit wdr4-like [Salvelinus fontinalis]
MSTTSMSSKLNAMRRSGSVSHLKAPHNIQAFCLGHLEFVSSLLAPPGHPQWLLSGSGRSAFTGSPGGRHVAVQCESSLSAAAWDGLRGRGAVSALRSWKCNSESLELNRENLQPHWEARQGSDVTEYCPHYKTFYTHLGY